MRTSVSAVYLDSSALVKLVVHERESEPLKTYLTAHPTRVSCTLARVEVVRAVSAQGEAAVARARQVLRELILIRLDDELLDHATGLRPGELRTLDAIHLSAAASLGPDLLDIVTYDTRMIQAAQRLGLSVASPGR